MHTLQAWSHPQTFGRLLATFSRLEEKIKLYQLEDGNLLKLKRTLNGGSRGVNDLCFAPIQHGPWLAAACADGSVRTYSPFYAVDHSTWESETRLHAAPPAGCCVSLSWAVPSAMKPPLLAVITTNKKNTASAAHVFAHSRHFLQWDHWCTIAPEAERRLQFVAWACNTANTEHERIALGVGSKVCIMHLRQSTGEIEGEEAEEVARLSMTELGENEIACDGSWSYDGKKLALCTTSGAVGVYTQSLARQDEWRLAHRVC